MSRKHAISLYLGVSIIAVLGANAAYAQNVAAQNADPACKAAANAGTPPPPNCPSTVTEDVVVTGSLLGTSNFTAPTPVQQITAVDIQTNALTGVGTLIGELPYAQPGVGLDHNTSGVVAATQSIANLRGLGANRTLTLIDGQRPTPVNATATFDTNLIPSALIDHFDVVTTGASASYGSDAVAGVVNLVLKDRMDGYTANVQYGISQYGDTDQVLVSAAGGTDFADGNGHFIIGGEFASQFATGNLYNRPWGRNEPGLVTLTGTRPAGLPANIYTNNAEVDSGAEGGLITAGGTLKGTAFGPGGVPYAFPYGTLNGSTYMVSTGNYGVSDLNRQLSPPYKREAAMAEVTYDFTPDVSAFFMLNVGELESDDTSQPTPFPVVLTILSGNPYIPASIQAQMTAQHLASITLASESLDGLHTVADNKNTTIQAFYGLKGSVFNDWKWDLEGNGGRSETWQGFLNDPALGDLYAATNAVMGANSVPVCATPSLSTPSMTAALLAQVKPGCTPLNPFGPTSASQGALNYIVNPPGGPDSSHENIRQYMFNADLNGSPFDLPAGPFETAFGANWRYDSNEQLASANSAAAIFNSQNRGSWAASEDVWEIYSEIGVPVVKDIAFAKSVDLNAAVRYTDYSISGGVTTWKYGATWKLDDNIMFRGTVSQDIRAPNLNDLFSPATSGSGNLINPISLQAARVSSVTVGNPNLTPEFAKNYSAGVVFTPTYFDWLKGLRVSVDYYRINITDQIASVGAQDVIDRCLVLKIQSYCNEINFTGSNINTTFGIATSMGITTSEQNLNQQIADGFDINIRDTLPIDELGLSGNLVLTALATYVNQLRQITFNSDGSITNQNMADTSSAPRWSVNANITYSLDRFTGTLQYRYYSPLIDNILDVGPNEPSYSPTLSNSINQNLYPAAQIWSTNLAYDIIQEDDGRDLQVYLNITNLLNTHPPVIWWDVPNYDVVGRYFKVGVRYTTP